MARVKGAMMTRKRRNKIMKLADNGAHGITLHSNSWSCYHNMRMGEFTDLKISIKDTNRKVF